MKTVLVTGASRGLGYYFVQSYLEKGNKVFAGARDITSTGLMQLKIAYPEYLYLLQMDVSNVESISTAVKEVENFTDHLDIIVNNAAIHSNSTQKILEDADFDDAREVFDINSLGPLRVVQGFVSLIRKGVEPRIINISSESGSISAQNRIAEYDYCMSKAALNMATKLLSNYLKKDNIIVLTVHPGWMRTDMGGMNAHLDPYETACDLVKVFDKASLDTPLFIDNQGQVFPW